MGHFALRDDTQLEQEDIDITYATYTTCFSVRLHHGGVFTNFPERNYVHGNVSIVDLFDADRFSLHEMDQVLEEIGYPNDLVRFYHYRIPDDDLDFGLRSLCTDEDVRCFVYYTRDHKMMNIYTEFSVSNVNTITSPSKVRIQEIVSESSDDDKYQKKEKFLMLGWHEGESSGSSLKKDKMAIQEVYFVEPIVTCDPNCDHVKEPNCDPTSGPNVNPNDADYVGECSMAGKTTEDIVKELFSKYMGEEEFDPFFGETSKDTGKTHEHVENEADGNNGKEDDHVEDGNEDEEEDSDFVCNETHDVEVDMRHFRLNTDYSLGDNHQDQEDMAEEVLDNNRLDSASESEENEGYIRKHIQRTLRKANEKNNNFYIGQPFGDKREAKELIKRHAVESRRQLRIIKDEKSRVRAVCCGSIPSFQVDENGVPTEPIPSQTLNKEVDGESPRPGPSKRAKPKTKKTKASPAKGPKGKKDCTDCKASGSKRTKSKGPKVKLPKKKEKQLSSNMWVAGETSLTLKSINAHG